MVLCLASILCLEKFLAVLRKQFMERKCRHLPLPCRRVMLHQAVHRQFVGLFICSTATKRKMYIISSDKDHLRTKYPGCFLIIVSLSCIKISLQNTLTDTRSYRFVKKHTLGVFRLCLPTIFTVYTCQHKVHNTCCYKVHNTYQQKVHTVCVTIK